MCLLLQLFWVAQGFTADAYWGEVITRRSPMYGSGSANWREVTTVEDHQCITVEVAT